MSRGSTLLILDPGAFGEHGGRKSPGYGISEFVVAGAGLPFVMRSGRFLLEVRC